MLLARRIVIYDLSFLSPEECAVEVFGSELGNAAGDGRRGEELPESMVATPYSLAYIRKAVEMNADYDPTGSWRSINEAEKTRFSRFSHRVINPMLEQETGYSTTQYLVY